MNTKLFSIFLMSFFNTGHLQDTYLLGILEANLNCFHKVNFNVYYITNSLLSSLHISKNFTNASHVQMLTNMLHFHVSKLVPKDCEVYEELRNISTVKINKSDRLKNILLDIVTEEIETLKITSTIKKTYRNLENTLKHLLEYDNDETIEQYEEYWSMMNKKLYSDLEFFNDSVIPKAEKYSYENKSLRSFNNSLTTKEDKLLKNNSSKTMSSRRESETSIRFDTRRVKRIKGKHVKKRKPDDSTSQEENPQGLAQCPFLVSVHMNQEFLCYGSIVTEDMVITAASCLQKSYINRRHMYTTRPVELFVRIIKHYTRGPGEFIPIIQVKFYPGFESHTLKHNLAIVKMDLRNAGTLRVENIRYANTGTLAADVKDVTVLGWVDKDMTDESSNVQGFAMADLQLYDIKKCHTIYSKLYVSTDTNFCAWYTSRINGACLGDVGGPAVVNGELIGIISFGPKICGIADSPTVFTRIGYYSDWIEEVLSMVQDITAENSDHEISPALRNKFKMRGYGEFENSFRSRYV